MAYTPGVDFKISGNSCVPNFSSISAALIVETATGVFLSIAKEVAVIIISSKEPVSSINSTVKFFFDEEKETSLASKPIKETTKTPESDFASKVNFPSKSVDVPFVVPFTRTLAPGNG